MRVNAKEAETCFPELLRAVAAGEEVVIANDGRVVARLVAAAEPDAVAPTSEYPKGSPAALFAALDAAGLPPSIRSRREIDEDLFHERTLWD